ncbi:MAG: UDP-N-acetylglucosamine 4,6-dehydratase [Pseudomonadota bacterium]|nr:UDP-N-acetylglucosamine 4,6-dehydratase [Pseudomonadota bacterium]
MFQIIKDKIAYLFKWEILALLIVDCLLLPLALFTAVWLRLGAEWDPRINPHLWIFFSLPLWTIPLFIQLGLYRAIIKFLDDTVVYIVFIGVSASVFVLTMLIHFSNALAFPRTAIIIYWLFALVYIGGSRFMLRGVLRKIGYNANAKAVAVYGAGSAGVQLVSSLIHGFEYAPMFFIDDDEKKWHTTIRGVKVYSPAELAKASQLYNIEQVLLAIPSVPISRRREIVQAIENCSLYVKTLPGMAAMVSGEVKFSDIKDVDIEDLLGRLPVPANQELLTKNIVNKVVLVTGAGGSIGSELTRQIANLRPQKLILLDSSEFALYTIEQELRIHYAYIKISVILASVTNAKTMEQILNKYHVNTIYHAAAYKHVPMVEANPLAGLENNVLGTYVVAQAALNAKVDSMVLISTDKAVRPTNVMGASKRLAELTLQAFAAHSGHTVFNMVRFGNVLGSSGSVVPLFKRQIKSGGPITVTHPDIIRYFMTIPEAVELVIQAGNMAKGGEVFVLDMGDPVKIVDLAKKMIYLSGFTVRDFEHADGDIEIKFTGLRPGEKLYEELLIGDNPHQTEHPRIMKANEKFIQLSELKPKLALLGDCIRSGEAEQAILLLQELVREYKPAL